MQEGILEVEHIEDLEEGGAKASLGLVRGLLWMYGLQSDGNPEDVLKLARKAMKRGKELGYESIWADTARWDVAEAAISFGFQVKSIIMEREL